MTKRYPYSYTFKASLASGETRKVTVQANNACEASVFAHRRLERKNKDKSFLVVHDWKLELIHYKPNKFSSERSAYYK